MEEQLGSFAPNVYRGWLGKYPDSPQAERWRGQLERLEGGQQPLLVDGHLVSPPGEGQFRVADIKGVVLEERESPSTGNTGALRTELLLDWLRVTIPTSTPEQQESVINMLVETGFPLEPLPYGRYGYDAGYTFLGGVVWYHTERLDLGVCVDLSPSCMKSIGELLGLDPLPLLQTLIEGWGGCSSRLDLAVDVHGDDIVSKAIQAVEAGHFTSRAKGDNWRIIRNGKGGQTVEIGSRKSMTFVRIYDKKAQQEQVGGVIVDEEDWSRVEYEYKGKAAQKVAGLLLSGDFEALRGVMYGHLDFKEPAADSNKRRWLTADWWLLVLGEVSKGVLGLTRAVVPHIKRVGDWLSRQCLPSLALWSEYCDEIGLDFMTWVDLGRGSWKGKHRLVRATIKQEVSKRRYWDGKRLEFRAAVAAARG